jgi:hypothetical protein
VLSTLVHRAKAICDPDSLPQELEFLHNTFQNNGYIKQQILQVLNPPKRAPSPHREDPTSVAFSIFFFFGTTLNDISRVLSKQTS